MADFLGIRKLEALAIVFCFVLKLLRRWREVLTDFWLYL
jgi:hypothetical protein